ncbi:ADP-heptose--lipooligosaccharide heptosyltransferase II [hydrothermal vent metagenome]|uniref:ADP-heptose--lipooligosaccharide heptosyltransferase II n=1 Tax=hydrothermal vent metagenome TaxID=652676 RepID=A0A3B1BE23_9ZZZZ
MNFNTDSIPRTLCILRLSAIGDICHLLPVVRSLQHYWPQTKLTWIVGKQEHNLVGDIPGIEFIIFDKSKGWAAYKNLYQQLRGRHFDVLLHMQMSLRASIASRLIPADIRLGFDRKRANDLQWLFTNKKIPHVDKQHVVDSFFGFIETLGIHERVLKWDIPISESTHKQVKKLLPKTPYVVISPCSSMAYRNWTIEGYAAVAKHITEKYGKAIVLTGGPSEIEREYGNKITALCQPPPTNLIGKTSLKELLAVIDHAEVVIAPDSGPAHMATAVNTPVIGLYACTNPDRARPYKSARWVIDKYHEAIQAEYNKTVDQLSWGIRVRKTGTMDRISVADVTNMFDKFHNHRL